MLLSRTHLFRNGGDKTHCSIVTIVSVLFGGLYRPTAFINAVRTVCRFLRHGVCVIQPCSCYSGSSWPVGR